MPWGNVALADVCGFDMSAANLYRWHPAYAAGVPLATEGIVPLSEPVEVWYFDLGAPPDRSDTKTVDVHFTRCGPAACARAAHGRLRGSCRQPNPHLRRRGRLNAVMFWYKLHLIDDIYLSTGPEARPPAPFPHPPPPPPAPLPSGSL